MIKPSKAATLFLIGAGVAALIISYHLFDPTHSVYAPKCLLKSLTGYDCPGCGCQRLLYHWANGRFMEGLRYNYFFPIGLLYAILILEGRRIPIIHHICTSAVTIYSFVTIYLLWWIVRNLLHI